jgi:hypothetical protein
MEALFEKRISSKMDMIIIGMPIIMVQQPMNQHNPMTILEMAEINIGILIPPLAEASEG